MFYRGRRLRTTPVIRSMMRETELSARDLILPIFVVEGEGVCRESPSLKGVCHYSVDMLDGLVAEMRECGVLSCILFGIPDHKDACGSAASDENGVVQRAMRRLRELCPEMYIIGDVCMCEYTDHGHCGILDEHGYVKNDETLLHLNKIAVSYTRAGADMVAPSDMMDGHVASLRAALDAEGFVNVAIMGYSAKFASSFYGPFRDAAGSAPSFGDRKSYQMDFGNGQEALREIAADLDEGADVIMVKPALAYLDVIRDASREFNAPLAAYNVSGEYAMLRSAVDNGILAESAIYESLLAIKRAGAKLIITYFALEIAKKLKEGTV